LNAVTDTRHAHGKVYPLPGVLGTTVLGLTAGCRSMSAISCHGRTYPEVLALLGLTCFAEFMISTGLPRRDQKRFAVARPAFVPGWRPRISGIGGIPV
jgi:hypothetical protein